MLLCAFHTLSYAFKRKKAKRPLPLNYTIVRLSRCAAGKKRQYFFQMPVVVPILIDDNSRGGRDRGTASARYGH